MNPTQLVTYNLALYEECSVEIDIAGELGAPAHFTQISNTGVETVWVTVNRGERSKFPLESLSTQIFNGGEIDVSQLEFYSSKPTEVQVMVTIKKEFERE